LFKSSYSFDDIFKEEFNNQLLSFPYRCLSELESTIEDYKNIVLIDDIRKGLFISFEGEYLDFRSVSLERTVSRGKKYTWIISNFINDDGLVSFSVLLERLMKLNNFSVPTKNK
jgi:hypothetical protein